MFYREHDPNFYGEGNATFVAFTPEHRQVTVEVTVET